MSLVINNNMMAANAARNLSNTYGKLSTSVQRMSSGLRINSAADDAAGLAIREMMRADISTTQQGIRNAADAISLIQTADGALAVIDEKLTRMKELAEQAATGTYTTVQRDIINSEYQAMAAEIDRIANATNFNGVKLLDGSITNMHGGSGMKIHFGVGNNEAEDYYYINMGDARATSKTGLRLGGDAKNDIWGQGAAASGALSGPGCCTAGFTSLNNAAGFISGQSFSFGYNWDWQEENDPGLLTGKYLAGRYTVGSSDSLQDLIDKVNMGTQSRVAIKLSADSIMNTVQNGGTLAVCVGNETYGFGDEEVLRGRTVQNATATYTGLSAYGVKGETAGVTYWSDDRAAMAAAGIKLDKVAAITASAINKSAAVASASAVSKLTSAVNGAVGAWGAGTAANVYELSLTANPGMTGTATSGGGVAAAGDGSVRGQAMPAAVSGSSIAHGNTVSGIKTGLWADASGNFATAADSAVAKALGFTEVTASVTTSSNATTVISITYHIGGKQFTSAVTTPFASVIDDVATAVNGNTAWALGQAQTAAGTDGTAGRVTATQGVPTTPAAAANSRVATKEVTEGGVVDHTKNITMVTETSASAGYTAADFNAAALASAINNNPDSEFWAMLDQADNSILYVFHKEGGNNNDIKACEASGRDAVSRAGLEAINFQHVESGSWHASGTSLSLGGEFWGTLKPTQTKADRGNEVWNVTLNGRDVGKDRDLWITNPGELLLPGMTDDIIASMNRDSFMEIQNAADGNWAGAEVRTQSSAQESLDAITEAIIKKDKIRADLGAMQNRLENTITNLEIQAENLQSSESRISDVDVAKEMTEFTKNNVLVQAGVSMLAQANSMSQLALSLLG